MQTPPPYRAAHVFSSSPDDAEHWPDEKRQHALRREVAAVPSLVAAWPLFKLNDLLGAPELHDFGAPFGFTAPSTVRCLQAPPPTPGEHGGRREKTYVVRDL